MLISFVLSFLHMIGSVFKATWQVSAPLHRMLTRLSLHRMLTRRSYFLSLFSLLTRSSTHSFTLLSGVDCLFFISLNHRLAIRSVAFGISIVRFLETVMYFILCFCTLLEFHTRTISKWQRFTFLSNATVDLGAHSC